MTDSEIQERLAAIEHQRWADWQKWMHDKGTRNADGSMTIPADLVRHWDRQIATPYEQLSEKEKDSDREQVFRYWDLFLSWALKVERTPLRAEDV